MTATNDTHQPAAVADLIGREFPILDHGSVTLLDVMGSDAAIESAARVSFTGGEGIEVRTEAQREGLIRYLMRHRHTTPFEMVEFKFRIVCPIFVWRQWIRHRTASVNEISGRYATLPDISYVPDEDRLQLQSQSNKQGSAPELVQYAPAHRIRIGAEQKSAREAYEHRLDAGMAKELARVNLPVSQYTAAVWKCDLHNLFHFLSLRMDKHAQYEIRVFTDPIAAAVRAACPMAWQAFEDFRLGGVFLTRDEIRCLAAGLVASEHAEAYATALDAAVVEINDKPTGADEAIAEPARAFKTTREATEFAAKLRKIFA